MDVYWNDDAINSLVHTVQKNEKFTLTWKIFRGNSLQCKLVLLNSLISQNFREKLVRVNFRNFHTVIQREESPESTKTKYMCSI